MKPQAPIRWHGQTLKTLKEIIYHWAEVDYPLGWPCQLKATKTGANFWLEIRNQAWFPPVFARQSQQAGAKFTSTCCLRLEPENNECYPLIELQKTVFSGHLFGFVLDILQVLIFYPWIWGKEVRKCLRQVAGYLSLKPRYHSPYFIGISFLDPLHRC